MSELRAVSCVHSNGNPPNRGLNIYSSTGLLALTVGLVVFLLFFRYQYVRSGSETTRVDRIVGNTCIMPCLPAMPKPRAPPSDLLVQRAIVAAKTQPNAALIVLDHPETPDERYEWSAVPVSAATRDGSGSTDGSSYMVCYCKPDTNGFRWETHLNTGETFYVNDNATLSTKYGITMSTPAPTEAPASEPTSAAAPSDDTASVTAQDSVVAFYRAISAKQYNVAYNLQSDSLKSATSFTQFVAGYSTTQNVDAETNERDDGSNTVDVVLHATDLKNGQLIRTTYTGYWILESDGNGGWKLSDGKFSH